MSKVFISYSHDSPEHRQRVLAFSDQLRDDGIDCFIDQYVNGSPPEGWQRWMKNQIEAADFVLMICTPTYLKRFDGKDLEGGRGVNFEGVIISQELYDKFQINTKFISLIPDDGTIDDVPLELKGRNTFKLGEDYEDLYRALTNQPRAVAKPLGKQKHFPITNTGSLADAVNRIHSDRLPTVKGEFFGRTEELQLLDDAWAGNKTKIVQFIAPGGTGKTKLLRHWLEQQSDIDALLAWSFYSQGSGEDKQISASPFFSRAFNTLRSDRTEFASDEDKGEYLAELLRRQHTVLVLDGLEPLQHAGRGMRGELKDRGVRQLLKSLTANNNGLCIITTRIAVHELSDRAAPAVISHDLQNLAPEDGVSLLKSLKVQGSDTELAKAVEEYGRHALALSLLGNVLRLRYQGDVRKRDLLQELPVDFEGSRESRHAFKVMLAYEEWFADQPELALLQLLGLFDHPIEREVLQALWRAQIPQLTAGIAEDSWLDAAATLREEHHLLAQHESADGQHDELDCHPLIREYFGGQLRAQQQAAWQTAHQTLYDHYKALPEKELPDTLEEMQPLFRAVAHGCAAGLHQRALEDVYWTRIQRSADDYLCKKLGAFSDDLATVAHFFSSPWSSPSAGLTEHDQASVLSWAGFGLRALGRLGEALEPMQAGLAMRVKQEDWENAAKAASNLSELQLTLGHVAQAQVSAQLSVDYADRSGDLFMRKYTRTTQANALNEGGDEAAALELFCQAEQMQLELQSQFPRLYSLPGFQYCELLLAQRQTAEVLERYQQWVEWRQEGDPLLDRSLENLIAGRAHLQQRDFPQAAHWLEQAVAGLREAAQQDELPRALLARAELHRLSGSFDAAHLDLQEVFDIAEPSGMRLFLTDYHLEMARLILAEGGDAARQNVEAAAKLIADTGYHRRDAELAELQQSVGCSG